MQEYLNFNDISKKVEFQKVLQWLNIPFTEPKQNELRGKGFIINVAKNLYTNPTGPDKGGIINFVSTHKNIDLRSAAKLIKDQFLTEKPKRQIPELQLHYHPYLQEQDIPEDICELYHVGYVKDRSIFAGHIVFKVNEHYIGFNSKTQKWLFPKNFRRDTFLYIGNCNHDDPLFITSNPFIALKMITKGYINTVSSMGNSFTDAQKQLLDKFPIRFVCIG